MHENDFEPVWWDFGDFGHPGWTPVTRLEMRALLDGAERIVARNAGHVCDAWIQDRRHLLLHQAVHSGVTREWISQALLVTAVSGLMGYKIPDVRFFDV
jgi:hypothetical protein